MHPGVKVSLKAQLETLYLPLVLSFAEESALSYGLGPQDALRLRLACEELFAYLTGIGPSRAVVIEVTYRVYCVQVRFLFEELPFDPQAFNLTAGVCLDDDVGLREMGLLIASRSVEGFHIYRDDRGGLNIVLTKEKTYPAAPEIEVEPARTLDAFTFQVPDAGTLKLLARRVIISYPARLFPSDMLVPPKLADMVASGEYGAMGAVGKDGDVGGGILWHLVGTRTIEMWGPYLFNQPPDSPMAEGLVEAFLGRIAKTEAVCLLTRYATPEMPRSHFEELGSLRFTQPDGTVMTRPFYYRQLKEDPGAYAWSHPDLEPFLRSTYDRLFLARHLRLTKHEGEVRPPHSVLSVQFIRPQGAAILKPVWDGTDAATNIARHVQVLEQEGLPNIFFELDLARAWHANLAPSLMENGFVPRLLLPHGGEGDIAVFQREGSETPC